MPWSICLVTISGIIVVCEGIVLLLGFMLKLLVVSTC